ncbi:hypothetical protein [Halarchaeum salinum]|uniref:Uncharacterized protein n=1 Tax=Halarchaeum salinum TaxID=489912 RepID=A0AAV3S9I3_9EURY
MSRDNDRVLRFETSGDLPVWVWLDDDGTVWRWIETYDAPVVRDASFIADALRFEGDAAVVNVENAPESVQDVIAGGDA